MAGQRSQIARIGAFALHATHDPRETTKPARASFLARFEREVRDADPGLSDSEVVRRAEYRRKQYMATLALKSAQARRKAAK